ncbi:nucleotidyltransferase domain-containing protein [Rhizocola hellebori]|uniref:nucleotidyltransferase domain-containing protein n=1 Tax=Rhizocola hellebori TaxID=1392758 RepID=UPI00194437D9|nr:nucleotidyltransferase domain-containing protein [Rhizocola hellebori]
MFDFGVAGDRPEIRPAQASDFPSAPRAAVQGLVGWAQAAFGEGLVSVIVHGSLAWGCWTPSSDIDALLVVERASGLATFHRMLVAGDAQAPGNGFELSVLSRQAARSSPHPIGYLYHFSRARLARQSPESWDLDEVARDPDLAGHFAVAWTAGVAAYGLPARQVLRQVDDGEFLASIGEDVLQSCGEILGISAEQVAVPVYPVLNFARTLAWLRERVMLSKREGGQWLMNREPPRAALLTVALQEYADPNGRLVQTTDLHDLARAVKEQLS